ncbi:MAG: hypothetical protein CL626_04880 [Aurantimonas sp.]|jgi:ABC-type transporter Mla subunit MlaD|nr:hypothetical protein [Aurantimonas sp.]MAQ45474.1 hypothetical protein [Actibacterium sp.]MAQ45524.1 hypothetical protein [Actibacterium sp.]|tara:strand:+ start:2416 stop:2967 length:552 start_codon:yes stop_codon:yes gene_type:complete
MSDIPAAPAPLSDDELRETLDLLSTVLASVSDRVDAQTDAMDRLTKTATEARQAAFAARSQTSPENYGQLVGDTIDGRISDSLTRITQTASDLIRASNHTQEVLKKASEDRSDALRQLRDREQKLDRFKSRLPWFGLGAVVLALALTVMLPRFMASNPSTCAVLGASWTTTTTGIDACVFYQR